MRGKGAVRDGWLVLVRVALLAGAAMLLLGGLLGVTGRTRSAAAPDGGMCAPLDGWQVVTVSAETADGGMRSETGFRTAGENVVVPLTRLVEAYLSGRGPYWDDERRTVSLLGPSDVLSVHFPPGRQAVDQAVLNGEVIPLEAVMCGEQVYLPVDRLAAVLDLEVVWMGPDSLRLVPR